MSYHKSTGIVTYDPFRNGKVDPFWCVIECDKEITRYYRAWLQREKHMVLAQPSWDAHISVVRGERKANQPKLWNKYHKWEIDFEYQHGVIDSVKDKDQPGTFYWIDVKCPQLNEIRSELGLITGRSFHLTIGRTHY